MACYSSPEVPSHLKVAVAYSRRIPEQGAQVLGEDAQEFDEMGIRRRCREDRIAPDISAEEGQCIREGRLRFAVI